MTLLNENRTQISNEFVRDNWKEITSLNYNPNWDAEIKNVNTDPVSQRFLNSFDETQQCIIDNKIPYPVTAGGWKHEGTDEYADIDEHAQEVVKRKEANEEVIRKCFYKNFFDVSTGDFSETTVNYSRLMKLTKLAEYHHAYQALVSHTDSADLSSLQRRKLYPLPMGLIVEEILVGYFAKAMELITPFLIVGMSAMFIGGTMGTGTLFLEEAIVSVVVAGFVPSMIILGTVGLAYGVYRYANCYVNWDPDFELQKEADLILKG